MKMKRRAVKFFIVSFEREARIQQVTQNCRPGKTKNVRSVIVICRGILENSRKHIIQAKIMKILPSKLSSRSLFSTALLVGSIHGD